MPERVPRHTEPGEKTVTVDAYAMAALAIEVKVQSMWLDSAPEWGHSELGRRFSQLLERSRAVLGE